MNILSAALSLGDKELWRHIIQPKETVSLRALLAAGVKMEERGVAFFEDASSRLTDPRAKQLCATLSGEEREHAVNINRILARWHPRVPDPDFLTSAEEEIVRHGIHTHPISTEATQADILKYAIELEQHMQEFYISFEDSFPDEWRASKLEKQVEAERIHEKKLCALLIELTVKE